VALRSGQQRPSLRPDAVTPAGDRLAETKWYYDKWGNTTEEWRYFTVDWADYQKLLYTHDSLGRLTRVESVLLCKRR
jgi:hypothetical protein